MLKHMPWIDGLVVCEMKLVYARCDFLRKISACGVNFRFRVSNLALFVVGFGALIW